ncbi:hypothetical protein A3G56_00420 [Candidatus Falkowbacteria bacterium RIFCSPLOWO2_12_FULL_45_10]|uniref:Glycosyltransferase RgtA/B/C/D-like domain-containing protein n=1 Tax=Candidatus Falkowbacteria bacterium RIFCSPLOWO2_12_FULL_45_10 TaxID=1797990 RepID=A0A1F5RY85_9BACT|nr:MAG: hypothetical protein A3G56_00420 [Candidatus Falkowbacteria bacterium RIFCSPLOWO2_12_FULL_45_10]
MPEKIFRNWRIIVLTSLAVIFFILYSWYPFQVAGSTNFKFASPDETANYFWIKRVAGMSLRGSNGDRSNPMVSTENQGIASPAVLRDRNDSALMYFEPLNVIANDTVVPRSVRSDSGAVKPVSFLGIILIYGALAKIFGSGIIIYLTTLSAAVGALFFYGIIKRVFNENIALLSALMLFVLAPYWYYASRGLFHNVLFVDLVLAGAWVSLRGMERSGMTKQPRETETSGNDEIASLHFVPLAMTIIAGICFGLAIMTRASELIWLAPAMLISWLFYFKQTDWRKLILFLAGIFLALMPMFYYNQILYGGALNFGYNAKANNYLTPPSVEEKTEAAPPGNKTPRTLTSEEKIISVNKIKSFVLPFGLNFKNAAKHFLYYYPLMFWYLFWPALLGAMMFLYRYQTRDKKQRLYFISFVAVSVIVIFFYGPWKIHDNPNPASITIGNSYARYWLAMYVMSLPLAAMFFTALGNLFKPARLRTAIIAILIGAGAALNIQTAVFNPEEGLKAVAKSVIQDERRVNEIKAMIEPRAVIISERFDKFFWPEYKVIVGNLSNRAPLTAYANLVGQGTPLYYYGFIFPPQDMDYLNNKKLAEAGLQVEPVKLDEESRLGLYKLKVRSEK